jgi:hypothetical protein
MHHRARSVWCGPVTGSRPGERSTVAATSGFAASESALPADVAWSQSTQLAEFASCLAPEKVTPGGLVGSVLVDGGKPRDDFELRPAVERNTFEQDCFNEQRRVLGIAPPPSESSAIPANSKGGHVFVPSERLRGVAPQCGQSLQSAITIMVSEPIKTATGQINGNFSSTPTTTARTRRVLFICHTHRDISIWPPAAAV